MRLNKTTAVIIIAGSIGIAALTSPLFAHSGKFYKHRQHGQGHLSMMSEHGSMMNNPEKMIKMMSHELDLSDEQRNQATAKLDEYRPRMKQAHQALREGMKLLHEIDSGADNFESNLTDLADEQGRRVAEMIKLHTKMHVEFEQLLTTEQKVKLKDSRQNRGWHCEHWQAH